MLVLNSCKNENEITPVIQDIKELVFASGQLEWENAYNLTAQTDGVLIDVNFEEGDKVLAGSVLARIDNETNTINTQVAKEQLVIANENLTANAPQIQQLEQNILFAESKYNQDKIQAERYERLRKQDVGSKVDYENAQLSAKNSLANLNALQHQKLQILQQAKTQQISTKGQVQNSEAIQKHNQLIATESGTIIKKLKTKGDYVRKGEAIAIIADEQKIEAVLNVDENSIGKIQPGQSVYVQLNTNKNIIYTAKITEILPAFDTQTQSFICKVNFDEALSASLYGTQLEANVLVGEKKNAVLIPREYVGYGNKVNVKGNKQSVFITPGIISSEYVEVLSGIDTSDVLLPLQP
jgi:multidrug efflux pump subunit AcrA (membrane-fusion protein)